MHLMIKMPGMVSIGPQMSVNTVSPTVVAFRMVPEYGSLILSLSAQASHTVFIEGFTGRDRKSFQKFSR